MTKIFETIDDAIEVMGLEFIADMITDVVDSLRASENYKKRKGKEQVGFIGQFQFTGKEEVFVIEAYIAFMDGSDKLIFQRWP